MDIDNNVNLSKYKTLPESELIPLLRKEAEEYYTLIKEYKKQKYYVTDTEGFIISKLWLKKWKSFTGYDAYKSEQESTFRYNLKEYKIDKDSFPGEISNCELLYSKESFYFSPDETDPENFILKETLSQQSDFRIINKIVWDFFFSRYGGGPEIKKPTFLQEKDYSKRRIYEIYYSRFNLLLIPERKKLLEIDDQTDLNIIPEIKPIFISRNKSLDELKEKILKIVLKNHYDIDKLTTLNIKLWNYSGVLDRKEILQVIRENKQTLSNNELLKIEAIKYLEYLKNVKVETIENEQTDTLIVEVNPTDSEKETEWVFNIEKIEMKRARCDWCRKEGIFSICCICKDVWYCTDSCKIRDKAYHENNCKKQFEIEQYSIKDFTKTSRKGLVGLQNLGNTCFMNTSLQCISNCYELAQYFLTDIYLKDINMDNPLGTQGSLAKSFATLLKNIYYGDSSTYSPRNFKKAIGAFQSMFSGYQQHDTQEFLNYLLDGLHEDLNRVLKKPFIEKDEANKDDATKSKEQWIGFLRRNQSTLVDLLYGQYKSTITCPCSNISTTFDPFLSISLPMVNRTQAFEIKCYFIFYDISITPIELNVSFSTKTTITALRNKISRILNINPMSFLIAKFDSKHNLDALINCKNFLIRQYSYHSYIDKEPYFIFQINPDMFDTQSKYYKDENFITDFSTIQQYLNENNSKYTRLFEYNYDEEDRDSTEEVCLYYSTTNYYSAITKERSTVKYSNDGNYGLSNNYIPIQLIQFIDFEKNDTVKKLQFPRIVYVEKNLSLDRLYKQMFDYYYPKLKNNIEDNKHDKDKLFDKLFSNKSSMPFEIYINTYLHNSNKYRMKSVFSNEEISESFDGSSYLPISSEESLLEYINKIPVNEKDATLDNTFYFMNDTKKHYSNLDNRDIYLKIIWKEEFELMLKELNDKNTHEFIKSNSKAKESIDLDECFRQFCKEEQLEEGNEWYCPVCKNHTKAKVHMEIYKTPPILIIHLKRFKNNKKIDTLVDFPIIDLDMSNYLIGENKELNNKYDLFAVAHHYGGMGGGHYVASAKNYFDNKWYNFNDSSVSMEREASEVVSSSAYVLFYKHKDIGKVNLNEIYNKSFIDYVEIQGNK